MGRNVLDNVDASDVFKAFCVSFTRMVVKNPEILLKINKNSDRWKGIYSELTDSKRIEVISKNASNLANNYDWTKIEDTYRIWGRFGWITYDRIVPWEFWEYRPISQHDADICVSSAMKKDEIVKIRAELEEETKDVKIYKEAMKCFDSKCYTACASLLISLIDGELIRCQFSPKILNKKTGAVAGMRMVNDVAKIDCYGLPGWFHLVLINYEEYISTLFKSADGFSKEPPNVNRNYLHHGMSKRRVLKRDCIKLLIAYHQTLSLLRKINQL